MLWWEKTVKHTGYLSVLFFTTACDSIISQNIKFNFKNKRKMFRFYIFHTKQSYLSSVKKNKNRAVKIYYFKKYLKILSNKKNEAKLSLKDRIYRIFFKWLALKPRKQRHTSEEMLHSWLQNWCANITNYLYKEGI